jgi:hypothetical protein
VFLVVEEYREVEVGRPRHGKVLLERGVHQRLVQVKHLKSGNYQESDSVRKGTAATCKEAFACGRYLPR